MGGTSLNLGVSCSGITSHCLGKNGLQQSGVLNRLIGDARSSEPITRYESGSARTAVSWPMQGHESWGPGSKGWKEISGGRLIAGLHPLNINLPTRFEANSSRRHAFNLVRHKVFHTVSEHAMNRLMRSDGTSQPFNCLLLR